MSVTAKQTKSALTPATSGAPRSVSTGASARTAKLAKPNAFPKSARLLKHASFQDVYDRGRKHFSANMIFFYLLRADALEGRPTPGVPHVREANVAVSVETSPSEADKVEQNAV